MKHRVIHPALKPTPTTDAEKPRRFSDFATLTEAVDYAAAGCRGLNFYTSKGELYEVLPYAILRERAVSIARRLLALGLEKGARVALIADTSADFICFFIGCQYANVLPVPLPLPTSFGGREGYVAQIGGQIESSGSDVAISNAAFIDFLNEATAGLTLKYVGTPATFAELPKNDGTLRLPEADDVSYLQYSSGSTRFPKGVMVTHRSLMSNCYGMGHHGVDLRDDDRCASWLPFYHDMGLVGTFLTPLCCQVSVDYLPTEEFARRPLQWLNLITKNLATITYAPTFGYDICARRVREEQVKDYQLGQVRVAGIGAEMIRPDVLDLFARTFAGAGFSEKAFLPSYGLAECTLAVSFGKTGQGIETDKVDEYTLAGIRPGAMNGQMNGQAPKLRDIVNCGAPLPEYEVEIRDEDGTILPEHQIGKVFVRGTSVMIGYFRDQEATDACLSKDKWLDTGDMGFMLRGCIYIVGRMKDMIIINGKNHWPQDIEWAVEKLPGLRNGDIAAISIPGINDEEVAKVLVQCRMSDPSERLKLIDEVKKVVRAATGMVVDVGLVPPRSLPRTSSGKLSRTKTRKAVLEGSLIALQA